MTTFIQLSDLHIHGSMKKANNANCVKVIKYIVERYSSASQKPVVLLTGDITDDGKTLQYKNAVTILKPLVQSGFKVLAAPGNHDYGPWGNIYTEDAQARFQQYILHQLLDYPRSDNPGVTMEDLYPTIDIQEDVAFLGVDSVVGKEDAFAHFASGEVGKKQRDAFFELLHEHKDKKIVVFFHHHPFNRSFVMKMDDADEVMRMVAGRVDFLCFGHDHKSEIWPAVNNIDWIMASGKTTDRNAKYKFQFREATIDGDDNQVSMVTFKHD